MEYAIGSYALKRKRVSTLFKVEVIRLVVKTFLILDRIFYPTIIGHLTGSEVVVLVVTGDLSLVLPVTVECEILCSSKRIFSVDPESDIQYRIFCFFALDRIVNSLEVVNARFLNVKLICKCEFIIFPLYCRIMIRLEVGVLFEE